MKILIQHGHVIDPENKIDEKLDVLIDGNRIGEVGKNINASDARIIEAKDKVVTTGLVDARVHFREPGFEYKEDLYSGLRAAVRGGFTGICPMPSTNPVIQSQADVEFVLQKAKSFYMANVFPVACVTRGQEGKELTEFGELKKGGVVALSDDANSIQDSRIMRCAMEYAKKFDFVILAHCMDSGLLGKGSMNESVVSTRLGLHGIPVECESVEVARNIQLAELTGSRVHFSHISSKKSLDLIREAKKQYPHLITAETAPHYFTLTDKEVTAYNTYAKVNPPLRSEEDVKAVKEALKDGVIDVIASDHAPHADYEKDLEFDQAPFGMIGLETTFSLSLKLMDEGTISLSQLIEKMSTNPARILKIGRGGLVEGMIADISVLDLKKEWVFDKSSIESKSYNSPFLGWKMKGKATDVIVGGRIVMEEEKILG